MLMALAALVLAIYLLARIAAFAAHVFLYVVAALVFCVGLTALTLGMAHGQTLQYRIQAASAFQARANTMRSNNTANQAYLLTRRMCTCNITLTQRPLITSPIFGTR